MNIFGIKNAMEVLKINKGNLNEYKWNGFDISYVSNNNFCYVNVIGKIPVSLEQTIFDKYKLDQNSIEYNYKNNNDIKECNIYTKEGLVVFFVELQNYLFKNNSDITDVHERILSEINTNEIEKFNPYNCNTMENVNVIDMIKNNHKTNDDRQDMIIRNLLNTFDKTVNPFVDDQVEVLDPIEYVNEVDTDVEVNKNGLALEFTDKKTNNKNNIYKGKSYVIYSTYSPSMEEAINHNYGDFSNNVEEAIEYITLFKPGKRIIFMYGPSTKKIRFGLDELRDADDKHKSVIIYTLKRSIENASSITSNMVKLKRR